MQRIRKGDQVVVIAGRDRGTKGGIVDKTLPIDQSNVMLVNPETGKGERIGFKEVDGKKVRVFKSNGAVVGAKAE